MRHWFGELWAFLKERKTWWVLPVVLIVAVVGALIGLDLIATWIGGPSRLESRP
jgi:hypothetical protein